MTENAAPAPSPKPTGNPPPSNPDIWLAVITAAVQTYVHLGKVTGPVTTATISSVLEDAQNHQLISPAAAASVLKFVQTSEGAALVQNSAALATHAVTFINIQATASVTSDQPRTYVADQPRTYVADQPRTYAPAPGDAAAATNPATPEKGSS